MELIRPVTGIAQTQFILKARRTGGYGLGSHGSADSNPTSLCSKTTPAGSASAGSASKELNHHPILDQTLTDPLVKMRRIGKI